MPRKRTPREYVPRPGSLADRILQHMLEERGCWTIPGLAAELQIGDPLPMYGAIKRLAAHGLIRKTGRRIVSGTVGQPAEVFEVSE